MKTRNERIKDTEERIKTLEQCQAPAKIIETERKLLARLQEGDETIVDIKGPEVVEILITGNKVWVNVDGVCRFRAYDVKKIYVEPPTSSAAGPDATPANDDIKPDHRKAQE